MNEISEVKKQTPIEIALGVDEEGKTTAKKLYSFLEMDARNYSRWIKANIIDNEFAEEGTDYEVFVIEEENPLGGRPTQDFKITARFAKKLSMTAKNEKGEQAREYFIMTEDKLKEVADRTSNLSPQLQIIGQMFKAMADKELADLERDRQIKEALQIAEQANRMMDNIKEAVKPVFDNWRAEINSKFNRIQKSCKTSFSDLRSEMYAELDRRAGVDIGTRLRNRKQRMELEGFTKSAINQCNKMDIIDSDKALREVFSKIVTEYEIKYCA